MEVILLVQDIIIRDRRLLTKGNIVASPNHIWAGLNVVTELAKQADVDECFQSVSEGKSLIASAITGKGVSTSSTATFQTMANNIDAITSADDMFLYTFKTGVSGNLGSVRADYNGTVYEIIVEIPLGVKAPNGYECLFSGALPTRSLYVSYSYRYQLSSGEYENEGSYGYFDTYNCLTTKNDYLYISIGAGSTPWYIYVVSSSVTWSYSSSVVTYVLDPVLFDKL